MLREALQLDGLSTLQRASLLGELAIELIFDRDIEGRRTALAEQEQLLAALPLEQRGWLMRGPGSFQYAGFSVEQVRDRAVWVDALLQQDLSPSARLGAQAVLFWLSMRWHDGDGMARSYELLEAAGHQPTRQGAFVAMARSTRANLDGRLDDAERLADEAVTMLTAMSVPEATNYITTATLANTRERSSTGPSRCCDATSPPRRRRTSTRPVPPLATSISPTAGAASTNSPPTHRSGELVGESFPHEFTRTAGWVATGAVWLLSVGVRGVLR